jgi:hypothetical protein
MDRYERAEAVVKNANELQAANMLCKGESCDLRCEWWYRQSLDEAQAFYRRLIRDHPRTIRAIETLRAHRQRVERCEWWYRQQERALLVAAL